MDNFREAARALVACGAASEVSDAESLAKAALHWLRDPAAHDRASEAGRAFVAAHAGATRRTLEALSRLIPEVFALKVGS
jgi:3-deoxy-D-manno-octulosonic-acid transferase